MSDYIDPTLYLCPHCGQVIAIGNDELAGDDEVVRQRMSHLCPGRPYNSGRRRRLETGQRSGNQPGGGGAGHNRARSATIEAGRHAQKQQSAASQWAGPRPPTASPGPTGLPSQRPGTNPHPGRLTLGGAACQSPCRHTNQPGPSHVGLDLVPPLYGGRALVRPALSNRACRDARPVRAPHAGCSKRRQYSPIGVSPRAPADRFLAASGTLVSRCPSPTASCY